MSAACTITPDAGAVRSVLWAVDCNTRNFARQGFEALAGGPMFQGALTTGLIIYVALIGWRMLFAPEGARLTEAPRTALKIGAILALVASWGLFQTLVFDLAAKAPTEIAALVSARSVGAAGLQDPVGQLQSAYDELSASASAFGKAGPPTPAGAPAGTPVDVDPTKADEAAKAAAASSALATAAVLMLTVHTGVVAASRLAVDVLGAISPLFIALFLFRQTRGFCVGWMRAMAAGALITAGGWILILLLLQALAPWLQTLAEQRDMHQLDPRAGLSAAGLVGVFAVAQAALALGAGVIAFAFRLDSPAPAPSAPVEAAPRELRLAPVELTSRAGLLADQLRRFDHVVEARGRAASLRDAVSARTVAAGAAPRAADAPGGGVYRRSAVAKSVRRLGDLH